MNEMHALISPKVGGLLLNLTRKPRVSYTPSTERWRELDINIFQSPVCFSAE